MRRWEVGIAIHIPIETRSAQVGSRNCNTYQYDSSFNFISSDLNLCIANIHSRPCISHRLYYVKQLSICTLCAPFQKGSVGEKLGDSMEIFS